MPASAFPPAIWFTLQATAVLTLPVTVAVNCWVEAALTVAAAGDNETATLAGENVAVTSLSASMVTLHAPEPEQASDQPAKTEPASGIAVRVTEVPAG